MKNTVMKRASILLIMCAGLFITTANAKEETALDAAMVNPGYHEKPKWFKQSFLDIKEDIEEANENGKRLLLYFYQDGCPYCSKLLQDNFGQRKISKKTQNYFDVIAINMWGDREVTWIDGNLSTEKGISSRMRVMFTPTMLFLDEKGGVALRVNGYYAPDKFEAALDFVGRRMERKMAFSDYYKKKPDGIASGKLHAQKFILNKTDLSKLTNKPLLVLFDQKHCGDCDELHTDIFKRKETLEQLKRFNVVRFDMWSKKKLITPKGREITARDWAKRLKVQYAPTMVMFDQNGKEIIRTEAYLKSFHVQSVMDYAASGAYEDQPSFQRFIAKRAERIEATGVHVDLMK